LSLPRYIGNEVKAAVLLVTQRLLEDGANHVDLWVLIPAETHSLLYEHDELPPVDVLGGRRSTLESGWPLFPS
jgi:hypothetical protein